MPLDPTIFTKSNLPETFSLPSCMEYFTLTASPDTNLWRNPPGRDTATCPMIYTSVRGPFNVTEVRISAEWEAEWDQGGLVIFAGVPPALSGNRSTNPLPRSLASTATANASPKWAKAGLEFTESTLSASSVVASGISADKSYMPLYPCCAPLPMFPLRTSSLGVKIERVGDSLVIWYQQPSNVYHDRDCQFIDPPSPQNVAGTWRRLREDPGFFWDVDNKEIYVGVYASRPSSFASMVGGNGSWGGGEGEQAANALVVEFEDFEIV